MLPVSKFAVCFVCLFLYLLYGRDTNTQATKIRTAKIEMSDAFQIVSPGVVPNASILHRVQTATTRQLVCETSSPGTASRLLRWRARCVPWEFIHSSSTTVSTPQTAMARSVRIRRMNDADVTRSIRSAPASPGDWVARSSTIAVALAPID